MKRSEAVKTRTKQANKTLQNELAQIDGAQEKPTLTFVAELGANQSNWKKPTVLNRIADEQTCRLTNCPRGEEIYSTKTAKNSI